MPHKPKHRARRGQDKRRPELAKRRTFVKAAAEAEVRRLQTRLSRVLKAAVVPAEKGGFYVELSIATDGIAKVEGGLPLLPDHEEVELRFDDSYPNEPPIVRVRHQRFVGYPHVLVGQILCIYLDTDREWHPAMGLEGVVTRLIEWLEDAAADRFDSRSALYHPIGGLPPSPRAPGVLVVRQSGADQPRKPISRATLIGRTSSRTDLLRWTPRTDHDRSNTTSGLVLRTRQPMPFGLVKTNTLGDLLARVAAADGPTTTASFGAIERLLPQLVDDTLHVIVEVAHPADLTLTYLACGQAKVPSTAGIRSPAYHLPTLSIEWITVSDERPNIATRRDHQRPTHAYTEKSVEVWGCGGLGSWMAEFITRAGARQLVLRDSRPVTGGLLVRQNYGEADVGGAKAEQLATRLRSISDDVEVIAETSNALEVLTNGYLPSADLIIDATINVAVAAGLDEWARATNAYTLIAQVATDPRTATLGMLIAVDPTTGVGPATVDDATWVCIQGDPALERFHGFWNPPVKADQLVPSLGCSTPTFHGSAADLASIAGSLVSLLAGHFDATVSGTHLIEASHARGRDSGGHHFIPYQS